MPTSFKEIFSQLLSTRDGLRPSTQAFPPLDVDQMLKRLKVDERAVDNGSANQPSSDAQEPDSVEMEIRTTIEQAVRKATEEYRSQVGLYDDRIQRASITNDQRPKVEAAGHSVIADFEAAIINDSNLIYTRRDAAAAAEAEYKRFREVNRLSRQPIIVHPRVKALTWIVFTVLLLTEALLNGVFFARGSESGLIGGFSQAFVLSALNVGGARLYGLYGFPNLFHISAYRKLLGVIFTLTFVAWVGGLNLAIGHFRDLFVERAGDVPMTLWATRFVAGPLALKDAQSGILVLLGIALALGSFLSAVASRDRYPGYAAVGERRNNAIQEFAENLQRCLGDLTRQRDGAVSEMLEAVNKIRDSQFEQTLATQGRTRLHENFVAFLDNTYAALQRMTKRYRETNQGVRSAPAPKFFTDSVPRPHFLEPPVLTPVPDLSGLLANELTERINFFVKEVNSRFSSTLTEYDTVRGVAQESAGIRGAA